MNVIQIVSDTLRYDYLGSSGNTWIHTENLDRFAKNSMVFNSTYAASYPTIPQRRDLFTGRYSYAYSKWDYQGTISNLPFSEIILSQTLRQAGYVTMIIGDTPHLFRDSHGFDRGFDGWWWIRGQEEDRYMTNPTKYSEEKKKALGIQYLRNTSQNNFESEKFVAQTMIKAIKWLELNYNQHNGFFLHVDTFDPHEPWDPPQWYSEMYDPDWKGGDIPAIAYGLDRIRDASKLSEKQLDHVKSLYAGEVTMVDRWIGKLLQKIEDLGLFEETIVIFTSDHGTHLGEHNRIGKASTIYEEVAHVPLIIRFPDTLGSIKGLYDSFIQPPDLMPTILDLLEIKIPEEVQGSSIISFLRGNHINEREIVISSGSLIEPNIFALGGASRLTITSKDWVFLLPRSDAPLEDPSGFEIKPELYNLHKDPEQKNNVYSENIDLGKELKKKSIRFLESIETKESILSNWK